VGAGVGKPVESREPTGKDTAGIVQVCLLGPLTLARDDAVLALPASRKARALLAYLALAPRAVTRSQLCELWWDVPNDPRGELRWCLGKLRGVVNEPGRPRLVSQGDVVRLDLADCLVDAAEVAAAIQAGPETLAPERLQALARWFAGDFAEGLAIDRSPAFSAWLAAQRRHFRECHAALLEQLVARGPESEAEGHLKAWLEIAPLDLHVHALLFARLARRGQRREGDEHLAAAIRRLEAEGADAQPLREAWRRAKAEAAAARPPPAAMSIKAAGLREAVAAVSRRASIAVMPFVDQSAEAGVRGGVADALVHDVITRLAKLRSLFVIAQGTVFALHDRQIAASEAGRMLKVDYVVGGSVRRHGARLTVMVELAEASTGRIAWADSFDRDYDDALLVLDEIGNRIVASIASEIETIEPNRAILRPPSSLDAWEAHHRGLWHMYRFNKADNELARHFFELAVRLDPTFPRAYAGPSFTHFQNAFQGWGKRAPAVDRAFAAASKSLMVDDRDPAAHWALGRALWLKGRHDQSIGELEQAIDLSPNFAQGHYALAFVPSQAGDPSAAIASSDHSRRLSPFDPLLFGMLGARAMALVRLGCFDEAADWGVKAAARPNAHAHILAIALADRRDEALGFVATIRQALPRYRVDDFLTAMQFAPEGEQLFRTAAKRLDMA
jgi:DNA-binding SARP family transcriptional activator